MTHLGDRAAALVDNELDHDARDRALAHLAGCDRCRLEVEAARQVKSLLAGLSGAGQPAGLAARLQAIAVDGQGGLPAPPTPAALGLPTPFDYAPVFAGPVGPAGFGRQRPAAARPGGTAGPGRRPGGVRPAGRQRFRLVTASALSLSAAALTTAFTMSEPPRGQSITPSPAARLAPGALGIAPAARSPQQVSYRHPSGLLGSGALFGARR